VGVLRASLRHRQRLRTSAAHPMQHRHKAVHQMHRTRTQGVSDLTGATGMAIIKALLAGARAPPPLAQLRTPHCHHDADAIAKARQGPGRAAPLCALPPAGALSACSHQQLALCDQQINTPLETCADHSAGQPLPPTARRSTTTNAPRFEARPPLSRLAGVALTTIEGLNDGIPDPFVIRRIGVDDNMTLVHFIVATSGLRDSLKRVLGACRFWRSPFAFKARDWPERRHAAYVRNRGQV